MRCCATATEPTHNYHHAADEDDKDDRGNNGHGVRDKDDYGDGHDDPGAQRGGWARAEEGS